MKRYNDFLNEKDEFVVYDYIDEIYTEFIKGVEKQIKPFLDILDIFEYRASYKLKYAAPEISLIYRDIFEIKLFPYITGDNLGLIMKSIDRRTDYSGTGTIEDMDQFIEYLFKDVSQYCDKYDDKLIINIIEKKPDLLEYIDKDKISDELKKKYEYLLKNELF